MPASERAIVAATFKNERSAYLAQVALALDGFEHDHVRLGGPRGTVLVVQAGGRYDEAEQVIRRLDPRRLRTWLTYSGSNPDSSFTIPAGASEGRRGGHVSA